MCFFSFSKIRIVIDNDYFRTRFVRLWILNELCYEYFRFKVDIIVLRTNMDIRFCYESNTLSRYSNKRPHNLTIFYSAFPEVYFYFYCPFPGLIAVRLVVLKKKTWKRKLYQVHAGELRETYETIIKII